MIKVIGLMAEYDRLPVCAKQALHNADCIVLQSERVPCVAYIKQEYRAVSSMDDLFEQAEDFDALYEAGAQELLRQGGEVVFCAIGNVHTNGFVRALQSKTEVELVTPAYTVDEAVFEAGNHIEIGDYRVVSARGIADAHIDTALALVVREIDDAYTAGDVWLALSEYYAETTKAVLVCDGCAEVINLQGFSRGQEFGAGACLVIGALPLGEKSEYGFYDLVEIMKILRGKDGCPWDREQTHKTLRQYILEEAYEVLDAVDADDMNALYDELGDVLLQVVFHAEIARQCGEFTDKDVTGAVCKKMIGRHPHIFGNVQVETADDVLVNWEKIKRREKGHETYTSVLLDVPKSMGAMMRAYKLQKKASAIGFDWDDAEQAFAKVREEVQELEQGLHNGDDDQIEAEAGDLLFAVINVLRKRRINPEVSLIGTCEKFIKRFEYMEKHAEKDLAGMTLEEMDFLWDKAKKEL